MNYEAAAKAFKKKKGDYFEQNGINFQMVKAPSIEVNFYRFDHSYGNNPMNNTAAINYSINNQLRYQLHIKKEGFYFPSNLKFEWTRSTVDLVK